MIQDELMMLLLGFEKPGRETERQGYLVGWNGDQSFHTDRVSRGHTRYHASSTVSCEPAYSKTRKCEAMVIRRSFDGTATVEVRWSQADNQPGKRRILFVKGEPKAADSPQAMSYSRDEQGWRITFNVDEHFVIPEPLVFGG